MNLFLLRLLLELNDKAVMPLNHNTTGFQELEVLGLIKVRNGSCFVTEFGKQRILKVQALIQEPNE